MATFFTDTTPKHNQLLRFGASPSDEPELRGHVVIGNYNAEHNFIVLADLSIVTVEDKPQLCWEKAIVGGIIPAIFPKEPFLSFDRIRPAHEKVIQYGYDASASASAYGHTAKYMGLYNAHHHVIVRPNMTAVDVVPGMIWKYAEVSEHRPAHIQ